MSAEALEKTVVWMEAIAAMKKEGTSEGDKQAWIASFMESMDDEAGRVRVGEGLSQEQSPRIVCVGGHPLDHARAPSGSATCEACELATDTRCAAR